MISFEVKGGLEAGKAVVQNLKLTGAYAGGTGLLDRNFETGVRVTKTECFRLESRL